MSCTLNVSSAHACLQHLSTCWCAVMQLFRHSDQDAPFVSIIRSRQHWELSSSRWQFPKIQTFAYKFKFYHGQLIVSLFPELTEFLHSFLIMGFSGGSASKEPACNEGDLGLIPGLGRSPGGGKGYPFQYSDLDDSMDRIVHGVAKSPMRLTDFHFHFTFEKACVKYSGFTNPTFLSLLLSSKNNVPEKSGQFGLQLTQLCSVPGDHLSTAACLRAPGELSPAERC